MLPTDAAMQVRWLGIITFWNVQRRPPRRDAPGTVRAPATGYALNGFVAPQLLKPQRFPDDT